MQAARSDFVRLEVVEHVDTGKEENSRLEALDSMLNKCMPDGRNCEGTE